jgi:HrpA-like RNA helicase
MQRMGRCGRTQKGQCFRLYTSQDFDLLRDSPAPEILNADVTSVFLKALAFGFTAAKLPFIDQPPTESLMYAHELLLDL